MALYDNSTFVVRDFSQKSKVKIRQKVLFGFVLTHLFSDVEQDYQSKFGEILEVFLLLSCFSEQMNCLLHTVQYKGNRRSLNKTNVNT